MGFPAEYSGFIISKILFNAVFLLSTIRNGICWFLRSIGLADLLESDVTWADLPENSVDAASSVSAEMIRKCLPVIEYGMLADRFGESDAVTCAVCLNEFENSDEIRQLTNCCHIFHKNCLDKWLEHDQKTCPLCRSCLMSEVVEEEISSPLGILHMMHSRGWVPCKGWMVENGRSVLCVVLQCMVWSAGFRAHCAAMDNRDSMEFTRVLRRHEKQIQSNRASLLSPLRCMRMSITALISMQIS